MSQEVAEVITKRSVFICDWCGKESEDAMFHRFMGYDFHPKCAYEMFLIAKRGEKNE